MLLRSRIILLCFLSGYSMLSVLPQSSVVEQESAVCDLNTSTKIIVYLLSNNMLATVLEPSDAEDIDRLIKNFSPVEIAFEAEVLNCTLPTMLFFVEKSDPDYYFMHNIIEETARVYYQKIKCVEIDTDELFTITEPFFFERLPALFLMHQRHETARSGALNRENFEEELSQLIKKAIENI